jgi:two-component system, NtrC family, response regulator AtoC
MVLHFRSGLCSLLVRQFGKRRTRQLKPSNILVVDDEPQMLGYLRTLLEVDSHRVETDINGSEALERVQRDPVPDVVLLDLLMPDLDGLETLERMQHIRPGLKVIMLSCVNETRKVVEAIRLGAQDYLTKPFKRADLQAALARCLAASPAVSEPAPAGDSGGAAEAEPVFVVGSPVMERIRDQVLRLAKVDVSVLLLGESGTGKEVLARLLHRSSARADRRFLKVNCAALPADLMESELFGYEAGAFTGATKTKPGKFEQCNQGTILLDEIGELLPNIQAKLLHVLQDQEFSRLGSPSQVKVDVRVLAATNIEMQKALAEKAFREDLYYRLNAFTIAIPPLRERREEIPLFIRYFLKQFAAQYSCKLPSVCDGLMAKCLSYPWPGNVRELANFVKRFLILKDTALALAELEPQGQQVPLLHPAADPNGTGPSDLKSLVRGLKGEAERGAIAHALEETKWNRKEAARLLNISCRALHYKIQRYGIERGAGLRPTGS